jgi:hypothetical protein
MWLGAGLYSATTTPLEDNLSLWAMQINSLRIAVVDLTDRLVQVELENKTLKQLFFELKHPPLTQTLPLQSEISVLENK